MGNQCWLVDVSSDLFVEINAEININQPDSTSSPAVQGVEDGKPQETLLKPPIWTYDLIIFDGETQQTPLVLATPCKLCQDFFVMAISLEESYRLTFLPSAAEAAAKDEDEDVLPDPVQKGCEKSWLAPVPSLL